MVLLFIVPVFIFFTMCFTNLYYLCYHLFVCVTKDKNGYALQGDILFLHMSKEPIRAGEIVVFNIDVSSFDCFCFYFCLTLFYCNYSFLCLVILMLV